MPAAELRGGFALPGGVGFTDGERLAVAWRDGDGVRVHLLPATRVPKLPPVLRGVALLLAMLRDAWRALGTAPEVAATRPLEAFLALLLTLLLAPLPLLLALYLPMRGADALLERGEHPFLWYLAFESLSLALLLAYFRLMASLPWSGRVLSLHGAEHQVAHALERGLPLEEEAVRGMPLLHPRCGTNFLALSALVAALFYALVLPLPSGHPLFLPLKLLLLPLAAGLGYEVHRLAERFPLLLRLGYLFQRLTVAPPSPEDREVAIRAARSLLVPRAGNG